MKYLKLYEGFESNRISAILSFLNKKIEDKINKLKDKEVKALLFDKYLRETNNSKEGNQSLTRFFINK